MFRHTLFLGTFVFDKLWSLYLGRPSAVPITILDIAHQRSLNAGWAGPPTLTSWVNLCSDMSQISDILNRSAPLDLDAQARLTDLDAKIQARCEALPFWLQLNESQVSELPVIAYGLHIQISGLRVVLHRLLSKAIMQAAPDARDGSMRDQHSRCYEHSCHIIYENAIRIVRLVLAYQQICGIENVITVMLDNMYVAAAVLVSHLLRLPPDNLSNSAGRDMQWLRSLADMLFKAQRHYPVTVRMRSSLAALVDDTVLAGTFGTFMSNDTVQRSSLQNTDYAPGTQCNAGAAVAGSQDIGMLEQGFIGNDDRLFQDMDLRNMMCV